MTPDFSPFSYTLNNPVNFIDEFGLSGSGWNTRGRQETEAETANKEQMDNPTVKRVEITQNAGSMANIPDGGSKVWYKAAKDFVMSDGPAYKDMSSFRQGINDIGNSSFVRSISEWNPFNDGMNVFTGIITGKNLQGEKMSGASIALTAFMATPIGKAGKLLKVAKYSKLADKTHKTAATFNNTTSIHTKIMFNDITKGLSKKLINTHKGKIVKASVGNNMYIQMRNFDKSGSHTTFDFIDSNRLIYEFKFNK